MIRGRSDKLEDMRQEYMRRGEEDFLKNPSTDIHNFCPEWIKKVKENKWLQTDVSPMLQPIDMYSLKLQINEVRSKITLMSAQEKSVHSDNFLSILSGEDPWKRLKQMAKIHNK
jgi:hypothetical protein